MVSQVFGSHICLVSVLHCVYTLEAIILWFRITTKLEMPILSGFCILGYNFSDLHIHPTLDVVLHPFMYKHKLKVVKDFFFKPFSSLHVCTTKCSSPWVFAPDQDSIKIRYLCKYVLSFSNYIETIYIPSSIYQYKNKNSFY